MTAPDLPVTLTHRRIRVNAGTVGPGRVIAAKGAVRGTAVDAFRRQILDVVALKRMVAAVDVVIIALYAASSFGASIAGRPIDVNADAQTVPQRRSAHSASSASEFQYHHVRSTTQSLTSARNAT
jgi:enoyl-[acyl-carrier-protein] reductase (NADH)